MPKNDLPKEATALRERRAELEAHLAPPGTTHKVFTENTDCFWLERISLGQPLPIWRSGLRL